MSGILDKKSRLFDYIITNNGRDQIARSDINVKYASVSDQSIVYNKDYEKSSNNKAFVDASEDFYFPFESSISDNNFVTEENLIENNYRSFVFFKPEDLDLDDDILYKASSIIKNNYSFSAKIKNRNIILNKNYITTDNLDFKISGNFENNEFNFRSTEKTNAYPTVVKNMISVSDLPVLAFDKRFETKNNFLKLSPLNSTGEKIFDDDNFNNMSEFNNSSKLNSILKSYNQKVQIDVESLDRGKMISKVIKSLFENKKIFKKHYEISNITESDTLFFEMFEINKKLDIVEIEKLIFVNCGEFYDNMSGKLKQVYLIGKMLNSRNKDDIISNIFKESESLGSLDTSFITSNSIRINNSFNEGIEGKTRFFLLSSYYSFINMFILVAE